MFILEASNLRVGDIVLTTQNAPVSKAIRKATSGQFSHAMLYVADHCYIHADADGVHSGNTQRILFEEDGHAAIFRLRDANPAVVERACMYARSQVGMEYSVSEAIRSTFRRTGNSPDESNRQFCSRLIAQAYADAGLQLVPNPDYCYPIDLADSPLLVPVNSPLRRANPAEIVFAESESPLERQKRMTNFILKEVRKLCGQDIQTFEQLPVLLIQNPQYDGAVCEIVKASGYLDFWKVDVLRHSWRYDAAKFLQLPVPGDERVRSARQELPSAVQQLQQFTVLYDQYMAYWQQTKLSYFATELQLYSTLIEVTTRRIEAAQQVIAARL